ncbi:ankyrin repeat-containing protein [Trifolium repens]|nr:ankyrin repeat-containing protein [Trifolium repens]
MEVDSENIKEKDLFKAAEEGDSSIFESLSPQSLSKSLSLTNEDARSLLHVATSSGHSKVVKILLSCDASAEVINSGDEEGWAPLHSAASIGNLEILEALLNKGLFLFYFISLLISSIKNLLFLNSNFEVKFVKRQANSVAHMLARVAGQFLG